MKEDQLVLLSSRGSISLVDFSNLSFQNLYVFFVWKKNYKIKDQDMLSFFPLFYCIFKFEFLGLKKFEFYLLVLVRVAFISHPSFVACGHFPLLDSKFLFIIYVFGSKYYTKNFHSFCLYIHIPIIYILYFFIL